MKKKKKQGPGKIRGSGLPFTMIELLIMNTCQIYIYLKS